MTLRIGVDVGGTSIRLRPFPGPAELRIEAETGATGPEAVGERIGYLLDRLVLQTGPPAEIGIGVPGQVDPRAGTVRHAVNLGIDGVPYPLGPRLAERFGIPVHVENDVRAAALGAFHHIASDRPDLESLVYLSAGTGVSAGVVLHRRLHRGRQGIAGEIGHSPLGGDDLPCPCGLYGCLEAIAGGRSLEQRVTEGPKALFGDPSPAPTERDRVVDALARALRVLAAAYDPDLLVLGGSIGLDAAPLVREVLAGTSSTSPFGAVVLSPDRLTTLPPDADIGVAGAARLGEEPPGLLAPDTNAASAEGGRRP